MASESLPLGKLPPELLVRLLAQAPILDPSVVLGPGLGLDCAVVELGSGYLVAKSDPITFTSDEIGRYLVHINANDIATTGATPRWLLVSALLPEESTTADQIETIFSQVAEACREIRVSLIGGHTEITASVNQPVLVGTMLGEVDRDSLITPRGARAGDQIILTKGIPIEATAILAREFTSELQSVFSQAEIEQAAEYLHHPGISVLEDARLAIQAGRITAMHDPTEGGLATALWELAEASGRSLSIDLQAVPISNLSQRLCAFFGIDPIGAIASGALLLTTPPEDGDHICQALQAAGIPAARIGWVREGAPEVRQQADQSLLPRPRRDEIAGLFESGNARKRLA